MKPREGSEMRENAHRELRKLPIFGDLQMDTDMVWIQFGYSLATVDLVE